MMTEVILKYSALLSRDKRKKTTFTSAKMKWKKKSF